MQTRPQSRNHRFMSTPLRYRHRVPQQPSAQEYSAQQYGMQATPPSLNGSYSPRQFPRQFQPQFQQQFQPQFQAQFQQQFQQHSQQQQYQQHHAYVQPFLPGNGGYDNTPYRYQYDTSSPRAEPPHVNTVNSRSPPNKTPYADGGTTPVKRDRAPKELPPNREHIEKLLAATRRSNETVVGGDYCNDTGEARVAVTVRLPTRRVTKLVTSTTTASSLAMQLVQEHRLEFEFEQGSGDDSVLLWECIDGTRRPLRDFEPVAPVVQLWGQKGARCFLRTTSTALRNDVDSLASLVPRRDMLRTPPSVQASAVRFSRPSIMYNPHANQIYVTPASIVYSPSDIQRTNSNVNGVGELQRVASKLSPNDNCLRVKRNQADNDDIALAKQLVWGHGTLELERNRFELRQRPGNELVCAANAGDVDVYEWPHTGPQKYVFIIRAQQPNSRAIYVSTDSAKDFSVIRNAIYTARTKTLQVRRR